MKNKTFWRAVRNTAVLMLAVTTGLLAQTPLPTQFSGVINDYTPSTISPTGPWEMRGPWNLTLNGAAGTADFTATLTMELSDYTRNASNIDSTSGSSLPNAAHSPHHDRGRHSDANSYRRVRSQWPGQRYERWEPSAVSGVYPNGHHHRRNQRRIFEHHVAIRGWCAGSFRIAVDSRRGWQPDHRWDRPWSDAGHHNRRGDTPHVDD